MNEMNLKKKLMVLLAVGIMIFSAMPLAFAEPTDGQDATAATAATTAPVVTAAPVTQSAPVATQSTVEFTNDKYLLIRLRLIFKQKVRRQFGLYLYLSHRAHSAFG